MFKSKEKPKEDALIQLSTNFLIVANQYYNSLKPSDGNKIKVELDACKLVIAYLIPFLESRIEKCDVKYMHQYYEIWEKVGSSC